MAFHRTTIGVCLFAAYLAQATLACMKTVPGPTPGIPAGASSKTFTFSSKNALGIYTSWRLTLGNQMTPAHCILTSLKNRTNIFHRNFDDSFFLDLPITPPSLSTIKKLDVASPLPLKKPYFISRTYDASFYIVSSPNKTNIWSDTGSSIIYAFPSIVCLFRVQRLRRVADNEDDAGSSNVDDEHLWNRQPVCNPTSHLRRRS